MATQQTKRDDYLMGPIGIIHNYYRRYVYEKPNKVYRKKILERFPEEQFQRNAETLVEKGIVILENYFQDEDLKQMRHEFEEEMQTSKDMSDGLFMLQRDHLINVPKISSVSVEPYLLGLID